MGIGDKMRGFATSAQEGAKSTTMGLLHFLLRLTTGILLGLVIALIGSELLQYGNFGLFFVIVVVTGLILKFFSTWNFTQILIFDFICVLVAMLLRMYILVAP